MQAAAEGGDMTRPSEPTASVGVRPATTDDLPAIVAMRNDLNALELSACPHAAIQRMTLEQFTTHWGRTIGDPDHCWLIVEAGRQPAGFGLIYLTTPRIEPPPAFIQWAYLAAPHRRRGAGRMLFDHMADWARTKGAGRIELQFIEGNEPAERFWTKVGFRPYARKCVLYLDRKPRSE
jgi:GNAT superfamily N-acetyltransferase